MSDMDLLFTLRHPTDVGSGVVVHRTPDGGLELVVGIDGQALAARITPTQAADLALAILGSDLAAAARAAGHSNPQAIVAIGLALLEAQQPALAREAALERALANHRPTRPDA